MVPATTVAPGPYLLEEWGRPHFDVAASQTYLISHVCHLFRQPSDRLRWGSEPSTDCCSAKGGQRSLVCSVRLGLEIDGP